MPLTLVPKGFRGIAFAMSITAALAAGQAGAATGRTVGAFDVSQTGEQTYTIPINVPPGVKGLAPQLALTYEHRRLSRLSGVGWTISGLSTINRCPRTVSQDGAANEIQLTTADRFCLDGNRLRLLPGSTYGANGSTYRLQIDMAARVTVMGLGSAGDPQWFKVEHKDGLIYEYGNSADSRIESLATGSTSTAYIWALTRIKDREGNTVLFTYEEDLAPNGEYRIKWIDYTSNAGTPSTAAYRVSFVYEAKPAGDKSGNTQYLGGGQLKNNKRIDRIDVTHVPSGTLVRRYELTYPASLSQTGFSVLESVQECAGSPLECYTATAFSYSSLTLGVGGETPSSASSTPLTIDVNGDGRTDLVYFSSTWMYQFGNAAGGFDPAVNSGITSPSGSYMAFDYDQDGKDDILVKGATTWWVIRGNAAGLLAPVDTGLTISVCTASCGHIAVDFNGDGRDDLLWRKFEGIFVNYRNSSGGGFSSTATTVYSACGACRVNSLQQNPLTRRGAIDVNGDGIRDITFQLSQGEPHDGGKTWYRNVLLGGGKGVWNVGSGLTSSSFKSGDFNGDGYSDFAASDGVNLFYRLSTGKSLAVAVVAGPVTTAEMNLAVVSDWNSDGYDDILVPKSSNNIWQVHLSNGSGLLPAFSTGIATGAPTYTAPMDVNGDGLDDFGARKSNGQFVAWVRNGPAPDLMTGVADGYGNTIATAYVSIVQGAYTPGSGATFPNVDFRGPVIVPYEVTFSNGVGGTYKKTYAYSDAEIDILSDWQGGLTGSSITPIPNPAPARGLAGALRDSGNVNQTQFKGFGTIKVTDDRNGLVTITTYDQRDLPYNGMVTTQGLYRPGGTQPISTATMTLDSVTGGTGFDAYALPYVRVTVANEYEVQGVYDAALKRTVTATVNTIDAYGTITDLTTQAAEPATGANGVQPGETYTSRTLLSSVTNNASTWCLGKPQGIETQGSHLPSYGGAMISRNRSQNWDTSSLCRLNSEVFEPASPAYALTRTLSYDAYGNVENETLSGKKNAVDIESRQTHIDYITGAAEPGRLPVKVTNAESEITTLAWDWAKGLIASRTDPNGVGVNWTYDNLGRLNLETRAVDGTSTSWTFNACAAVGSGCINSNNRMTMVETERDSTAAMIRDARIYLDGFDRVLSTSTQLLSGSYDRVDREYNSKGQLFRTAAPCLWSGCTYYWTNYGYDLIDRVTEVSRPISESNPALQSTLIYYEGLTTRVIDAESKQSSRVESVVGAMLRTVDHNGYFQHFDHDGFGSPVRVTDSQSNPLLSATFDYGAAAFRRTSNDMDMGNWSYTPNAFGDVYGWTDAKTQSFGATFDRLSRPLTRTEPEGLSEWIWGTIPAQKNVGRLIETRTPTYKEQYQFQATAGIGAGRQIGTTFTAESIPYQVDFTYHATQGFLETVTYPQSTGTCRIKVQYGFQYGYLKSLTDVSSAGACGSSGTIYWQANTVNPRNQILTESLGASIATSRTFDAVTGELRAISRMNGNTSLQNLGFLYDKVGSLTQRQDNRLGLTENLTYDNLHRLDTSAVGATSVDYDYDPLGLGNITKKTDLGSGPWSYDPVKKHQLLSAAGGAVTYTYDANGNALTRNGQTITWTSYNYPNRIYKSGTEYDDFFYGPNRERWKQVYTNPSGTETTISLGKFLEKVTSAGATDWRHYLFTGEQTVAVYSRQSSGSNTVRYVLEDHQGNVAALASSAGALVVNESFTPFGQRRNGSTWQLPISGSEQALIDGISRRGYTEHTHLGGVPLIHMNGRVQDPLTGRFLSADPYVTSPMSTQGWNRYSYVVNSPATFTDPSGFDHDCDDPDGCPGSHDWNECYIYVWGAAGCNWDDWWNSHFNGGWTVSRKKKKVKVALDLPRSDLDTPTCGSDCGPQSKKDEALYAAAVGMLLSMALSDDMSADDLPALAAAAEGATVARVAELRAVIPSAQQGRITMAAGLARDTSGAQRMLIATSEPRGYLRPGVTLKPGEILVPGSGHAEMDIVYFAQQNSWTLFEVGATRRICPWCAAGIEGLGARPVTPLKAP